MKKSLIALAVLAASGTAMAQSSVTIYGIADMSVKKDKGSSTVLESGNLSGSRLGFKGVEDLGGGLKAMFKLEQGVDLASGKNTTTNTPFNRESTIGLAGGFGEVRFGRMSTVMDDYAGVTNPVFDSFISPTNVFSGYTTARVDQGIYYASPSFGGFSAAISYNLEQVAGSQNVVSMGLNYEAGPLYVAVLHQDEGDTADTTYTRLNGTYDFGAFKLLAGFGNKDAAGTKTKEYTIGADVPLSAALMLSAGAASSKTDGAARVTGYSVGATYSLSKRTTIYGGFYDDNGTVDSRYGIGVKHSF